MKLEELLVLTPEQKRVKIAEACGIKNAQPGPWYGYRDDGNACEVPDYLHDLNAIHQAEKLLSQDEHQAYCEELRTHVGANGALVNIIVPYWTMGFYLLSATAEQRANTFLQIKG